MAVSKVLPSENSINHSLVNLKARFLFTQFGSMVGSLASEVIAGHAAMSFSSLLMEGVDFAISKAVSYGCDPIKDKTSKFLNNVQSFFKMTKDHAIKAIRITAYVAHIFAAGAGMFEAYRLLGENFESPSNLSLLFSTGVAALNVWNYIDANKVESSVKGSTALALSGIKAMAQTNFVEMAGLVMGVLGSFIGFSTAGNFGVIGSSIGVIGLMARQIIREKKNEPHAYTLLKV